MSTPPTPRRRRVVSLALSLLLGLGAVYETAAAAEIEEVPFPDSVTVDSQSLPLFGLGLLRYRVLFRGYVGALYLTEGAGADRVLEDIPRVLELRYFWSIEGRLFGQAAQDILEGQHPPERIARLQDRLDRLHSLYRDVEPGDRYRLSYAPGQGTTLSHNGRALGTIPGADFASDYFGIWLGDDPLSDSFRDQILGGR